LNPHSFKKNGFWQKAWAIFVALAMVVCQHTNVESLPIGPLSLATPEPLADEFTHPDIFSEPSTSTLTFSSISDVGINAGNLVSFFLEAVSPSGREVHFEVEGLPEKAYLVDNEFRWEPSPDLIGEYSLVFRASDGVETAEQTITFFFVPTPDAGETERDRRRRIRKRGEDQDRKALVLLGEKGWIIVIPTRVPEGKTRPGELDELEIEERLREAEFRADEEGLEYGPNVTVDPNADLIVVGGGVATIPGSVNPPPVWSEAPAGGTVTVGDTLTINLIGSVTDNNDLSFSLDAARSTSVTGTLAFNNDVNSAAYGTVVYRPSQADSNLAQPITLHFFASDGTSQVGTPDPGSLVTVEAVPPPPEKEPPESEDTGIRFFDDDPADNGTASGDNNTFLEVNLVALLGNVFGRGAVFGNFNGDNNPDTNDDGHEDIYVASPYRPLDPSEFLKFEPDPVERNVLLVNNAEPFEEITFTDTTSTFQATMGSPLSDHRPQGVILGDIDNDGDRDQKRDRPPNRP